MTKSTMKMIKGLGVGMAIGGAVGMVGYAYLHSNKKKVRKSVNKALKSVNELTDNVSAML